MALSSDFLSVNGLNNMVNAGNEAIGLLDKLDNNYDLVGMQKQLDKVKANLEAIVDNLQKEIDEFLNALGYSSKKKFQSALAKFYANDNIAHFTGPQIKEILRGYELQSNEIYLDRIKVLNYYYQYYLTGQVKKDAIEMSENKLIIRNIGKRTAEEFAGLIQGRLGSRGFQRTGLNYGYTKGGSFRSKNFVTIEKDIATIAIDEFTPTMKKKLDDIIATLKKGELVKHQHLNKKEEEITGSFMPDNQQKYLQKILNAKYKLHVKNDLMQIGIDWAWKTQARTSSQVDKKERENINNYMIERLAKEFGQYSREAKRIMKMMAFDTAIDINGKASNARDGMFLVGASTNQIIGLLGEIVAILGLYDLCQRKVSLHDLVIWSGEEKRNGKKLSVDIVIQRKTGQKIKQYGVQVKGTSKDIKEDIMKIKFAESMMFNSKGTSMFDKLGISHALDTHGLKAEVLENILISNQFNVPFKKRGFNPGVFIQTGAITDLSHDPDNRSEFQDYITIELKIIALTNRIYNFLYNFTPDFLYMSYGSDDIKGRLGVLESDTNEALKNLKGNAVYMVGREIHFADDMLKTFIQCLEELKQLSLFDPERNINNLLQFNVSFSQGKKKKIPQNIVQYYNSGHFGDATSLASFTTKLTSSWGFNMNNI